MATQTTTTANKINQIVRAFDVSGERVTRSVTERRHGSKGFGFYTQIDVAYEGTRTVFFRNLADAQAWAQEMARG